MNLGYEEEFGDDYSYDGVLDTSMSYPSDPADQETPVMKNLASMLAAADTSPEASPILLRHDVCQSADRDGREGEGF